MKINSELISFFILDTNLKHIKLNMEPLDSIIKIIEDNGYKYQEDCESNGWQADFSMTFKKDNEKEILIVEGSLWYNGFHLRKENKENEI